MEFWDALQNKGLTPARLWLKMDIQSRVEAAESLYNHDWEGDPVTHEANMEIAAALRFRPVAIKKMSKPDRINYLAKAVRPSRSLISSLMLALHLENRSSVMVTFLDELKVPHDGGLIDEDFEFSEVDKAPLNAAVKALLAAHPVEHVDLYLATLYMMDPGTWKNLGEVMGAISTGQAIEDEPEAEATTAPKTAKTTKKTAKKTTKKATTKTDAAPKAAKKTTKKATKKAPAKTEAAPKAAKKTAKKATKKTATKAKAKPKSE
jgi:outer membrane biosynthesis protein TonB